ncbi:unnamed protein product, partial [Laminaria digitata]
GLSSRSANPPAPPSTTTATTTATSTSTGISTGPGTGPSTGTDSAGTASPEHHDDMVNYLTNVLAFPKVDALQALSNTSGTDLAEALDYLC